MANKLSDRNKILFYDFIVEYDAIISKNFGIYNIAHSTIDQLCEKNKILIGSLCKSNIEKKFQYKHYILWENKKPEKFKRFKRNDAAHNLLRHIRNAMAHGRIISENRQKFSLSDVNENGRITMDGRISMQLFYNLIDAIQQTII